MTEKLTSRYDKFIPIFRDYDDKRVRLFLNQLQESVDKADNSSFPRWHRNVKLKYVPDDIFFRWKDGPSPMGNRDINTPEKIKNTYYKYKEPGAGDNSVHPEWFIFFVQMSYDLGGKTYNTLSSDVVLKENKAQMFNILKTLKNIGDNTTEMFVISFLSKIAKFKTTVNGIVSGLLDFDRDYPQLDNISSITFYPHDIIMNTLDHDLLVYNTALLPRNFDTLPQLLKYCIFKPDTPHDGYHFTIDNVFNYWQLHDDKHVWNKLQEIFRSGRPEGSLFTVIEADDIYNLIKNMNYKEFTYKIDRYSIANYLESQIDKVKPIESNFFEDDPPENPKYYRNSDGNLVFKNENNEVINVGDTAAVNKLTADNKCYGTGVVDTPDPFNPAKSLTCHEYFRDCLTGKNIEECRTYLKAPEFWKDAKEEVASMLPMIAIDTLKAFDFAVITDSNTSLKKMENTETWLAKIRQLIPSKLTQVEYEAIQSNEKLIGYLKLVVKKINDSPQILNENYQIKHDVPKKGPLYNMLTKYGIKSHSASNLYPIAQYERLKYAIHTNMNRFKLSMRFPIMYPARGNSMLVGGGPLADHYTNYQLNESIRMSSTLTTHYASLIERLKINNKSISNADTKKISELIEKLKEVETKLYKTIIYTDNYADLIENLGDNTNNGEILTMDSLKEFVDLRNKTLDKTKDRSLNILKIIQSIAEQQNLINIAR